MPHRREERKLTRATSPVIFSAGRCAIVEATLLTPSAGLTEHAPGDQVVRPDRDPPGEAGHQDLPAERQRSTNRADARPAEPQPPA